VGGREVKDLKLRNTRHRPRSSSVEILRRATPLAASRSGLRRLRMTGWLRLSLSVRL
jgi:hypothetical protein